MSKPRQSAAGKRYQTSIEDDKIDAILDGLANGEPLRQICRREGFPAASTIVELAQRDTLFGERYARARSIGCDVIADEIIEISDESTNDWMEREGLQIANHEHISRAKLRIDARKWLLSKMKPEKYSDKQTIETSGINGAPIQQETTLRITFDGK